jgi:IMP dehydrogenase/GMP reductase
MAIYLDEESRTFNEFMLLPNLTRIDCVPENIRLATPLVRHRATEPATTELAIPIASAIMQAVSSVELVLAINEHGGLGFVHHQQPVADQVRQVRAVAAGRRPDGTRLVAAGIDTRDYATRVPALVEAGADILCVDSSYGHSEWQEQALSFVGKHFPEVPVGGGNVVDAEGFEYLANAGASFVKVGIGGGSASTTRDHKGVGRGQASAVRAVAQARDSYAQRTGDYVPICSDGGLLLDYHMALALAMGADFLMMGRYFARFDQSPGRLVRLGGSYFKEYWGQGSQRGREWISGDSGESPVFEEGVEGYVPFAGDLAVALSGTLARIRSTMIACGALDLAELRHTARIVRMSQQSYLENTHLLRMRERDEARLA